MAKFQKGWQAVETLAEYENVAGWYSNLDPLTWCDQQKYTAVVWGIMGILFTITYRFVFSSPQLIKIFRFELCAKTCDTFQTPARPTIGARNIPAPLGFAIDQACVCDKPCILLLSHVWDSIFSQPPGCSALFNMWQYQRPGYRPTHKLGTGLEHTATPHTHHASFPQRETEVFIQSWCKSARDIALNQLIHSLHAIKFLSGLLRYLSWTSVIIFRCRDKPREFNHSLVPVSFRKDCRI